MMASPAEKSFRAKDGGYYTVWTTINDLIDAAIPTYWSRSSMRRRERGWMFRGQADANWDLIPSLYRPPLTDEIIKSRKKYTDAFMNAIDKNSHDLELSNLSETKLLAVAQHYGFYTHLLDFTWNIEVAAYFATKSRAQANIGVIFGYFLKEYEEMRNPFESWGLSIDESSKLLIESGREPLPAPQAIEFDDVPRIYKQEGIFIECPLDKAKILLSSCIDRFYFNQRSGLAYYGQFEFQKWMLPDRDAFDSDETYDFFMQDVRQSQPELLAKTSEFGEVELFPPIDPISQFATKWKESNPDPTFGSI